jgi:hypothetical protein
MPTPSPSAESLKLAKELVSPGGHGDANDAALVVEKLAKFPPDVLNAIKAKGTKFIACRGAVTDYLTALKGVQPRGWPPGATWDDVPGVATPNEVVVATTGHGTQQGAHVPETGEGHGCYDLVLHEGGHAYDSAMGQASSKPEFEQARAPDAHKLDAYLSQPGEAGLQETFAETMASYYGGDPKLATDLPSINGYWASK